MKTMIIGRVAITEPANSTFHWVRFSTTNRASPSGAVYLSGLLTMISGQKKSSQAPWKVKMPVAASAGPHSGSTTRQKIRNSLGPVDPGGVEQLVGDRQHVLPEQEDAEGADRRRA